jgi:aldose 1-epimerase
LRQQGVLFHPSALTVSRHPFATLASGDVVDLIRIGNGSIELSAITYGCIITSLRVPDRHGRMADVVLGFPDFAPYLRNGSYIGALVGRYANRIARGRFELDGVVYQLATNDGPNHLHGGEQGFSRQLWTARLLESADAVGVAFVRTSPAGEDGYPGELRAEVTYSIDCDGIVTLHYTATTNAPTIVNLTQHSYFNLAGETSVTTTDHELTIHAARYTPVGPTLIPSGEIVTVEGTPFDFRRSVRLAERQDPVHPQVRLAGGFDHNFVLTGAKGTLRLAAELFDPHSGRALQVRTTEPGLQFYDGHLLDNRIGAYGRLFAPHAALCLETQHFPDSPNEPAFPSTTLRPGDFYGSTTTWRFSTR